MRLFYNAEKRALGVLCLPTKACAIQLLKKRGNIEVLQYHEVTQDESSTKENMVLLAELLTRTEPAKQRCCLALSPAQSFFFQKKFPEKTTQKNLLRQLIRELAEQFQLHPKNMVFDYQLISENEIQGLFAQKNLVDEFHQTFSLSNLQLNFIISLAQSLEKIIETKNKALVFKLYQEWFLFIKHKNHLNKLMTNKNKQIDKSRLKTMLHEGFQMEDFVEVNANSFDEKVVDSTLVREKSLEYYYCLAAALNAYEDI